MQTDNYHDRVGIMVVRQILTVVLVQIYRDSDPVLVRNPMETETGDGLVL